MEMKKRRGRQAKHTRKPHSLRFLGDGTVEELELLDLGIGGLNHQKEFPDENLGLAETGERTGKRKGRQSDQSRYHPHAFIEKTKVWTFGGCWGFGVLEFSSAITRRLRRLSLIHISEPTRPY